MELNEKIETLKKRIEIMKCAIVCDWRTKKEKIKLEKNLSEMEKDLSDYEEFCNRKLPEEVERLQKIGRTGTEAWIARAKYQSRKIREHLGL